MTLPINPEAAEEFRELMQDPASREAFVEIKRRKSKEGVNVRYSHILEAMLATPWAIHRPYMRFLSDLLMDRVAGVRISADDIAERIEAARRPSRPDPPSGVAVIPIHGPIIPRASMLSEVSGATSIPELRTMFREAMASKEVSSIVLDVDSPGGNVQGVPEMASEIRAARGKKPITAVANGLMASAAYWLGSQADEIVATKSGLVGSIGVITAHEDMTAAAEMEGVKISLVSAGKFKTLGHPMEPLTDEGMARVQATVDEFYGMFVNDVARGRKTSTDRVRNGFGEGDVVTAREALSGAMVDRIGSLEDVVVTQLAALGATPAGLAALDLATQEELAALAVSDMEFAAALDDEATRLADEASGDDTQEPDDDAPTDVVGTEVRDRLRRLGLMKHIT